MCNFNFFSQVFVLTFFIILLLCDGFNALIKPGRRVCPVTRASTQVVPSQQTYIRPFKVPCNEENCGNSSRVIYKVAVRTVFYRRVVHDSVRKCCPGWTNFEPRDQDCMKPECKSECLNGGFCNGPDYCACPRNFSGAHCEFDVDECVTNRHNCQQLCNNTIGGYNCTCYDGFRLVSERECEFCPLCLKEFESVMNKVDELQTRMKSVESSKEEIQHDFKDLQTSYKEALDKVEELREPKIIYAPTTTGIPKDDNRINPRNNFDLITSLSDQMGAIEEHIGFMMSQMGSYNDRGSRPRGRQG